MFGKYAGVILALLVVAALVLPLAGCSSNVSEFKKLDINRDGVLETTEVDQNNDGLVTPAEVKGTYARPVEQFLAHGHSVEDKKLTQEEFAQAVLGERMPRWQVALIALAVVVIPVPIGFQIAKSLRMPDYGLSIGIILLSITAGTVITILGWPPNLGIDLKGGVILIYEIDDEATKDLLGADAASLNSDLLAAQLRARINPGGVNEIVVRPYGPRQVEIIIPNVEEAEIEVIKRLIERTGQLEFFIVANTNDHSGLIAQALDNVSDVTRTIKNDKGETIGRWVPVGLTQPSRKMPLPDYRGIEMDDILRARRGDSKEFVKVDGDEVKGLLRGKHPNRKAALDQLGYRDVQALMVVNANPDRNIKGRHLRSSRVGTDQGGRPAVHFKMNGPGASLMGAMTSRNAPDPDGFHRRMAIIMDNQVISAPRLNDQISSDGIITGDFTQDEVKELVGVLNAGKLPAVMRKDPISQNQVSSLLGADTIRSGAIAIVVSLLVVLVFMMFYYRFAGVVACLALVINLVLILALMILVKATLTLPGIAGLVLTVGMSVDANVLIYERIREELARGAALRMAIRNGFQRATTTIVDANLTTLITGIVLYVIGTDQIRGFAVTLILGILMSMYTAIFCSRVVFDIAERKRWITRLGMMQIVGSTHIDFVRRRKIAIAGSLILICIGLGALIARGKGILDIDFNGGTSVQMLLKKPMPIAEIRELAESDDALGKGVSVVGVPISTNNGEASQEQPQTKPESETGEYISYMIVSPITGEEPPEEGDPVRYAPKGETVVRNYVVKSVDTAEETADLESPNGKTLTNIPWDKIDRDGVRILEKRLVDKFGDKLEYHSVKVLELAAVSDGQPSNVEPPDEGPSDDTTGAVAPKADASGGAGKFGRNGVPSPSSPFSFTSFRDEGDLLAQADDAAPAADGAAVGGGDEAPSAEDNAPGEKAAASGSTDIESVQGQTRAKLRFDHAVSAESVRSLIRQAILDKYGEIDLPRVGVSNDLAAGDTGEKFQEWTAVIPLNLPASKRLLEGITSEQGSSPVWLSSNKIGGQVAGNLQSTAIAALLASLLGIIGYIWFRFQRVVFGLAAVVALLHDVLITLGAIAVSLWVAKATMGVLLIDEFKISLPIVAALLTIIGYSLNDTIVVFDRIREVRGKNPELTPEMINLSINQTLSRTLLTSFTTLIVVLLLYLFGGQAIRGFAFALLVGVIVGTYSSIFIASPFLLWMMNATKASKSPKSQPAKSAAAT